MKSLFVGLLFFVSFLPTFAFAATLSVTPASGTYTVGQRVIVNVSVSSDVSMNAASGVLSFPSDILSVEYVNKGSVLNFWLTEPSYSNSSGRVNFEGVSLSGFQGSSGTVVTVAFRAKKAGTAKVDFVQGQILANDGQGTDITAGLRSSTYTFEAGKETPKPAPEPEPEPEPTPAPAPEVQKPDVLKAPSIQFGIKEGNDTIFGKSEFTRADVVLSFVAVSGSKVYITGSADSEGGFSLAVPNVLKNGPYAVTATMVLDDGRQSEVSEPLTVQVGGLFGYLSWEYATYVLLLILILAAAAIAYFLQKGYFGKPVRSSARVHEEVHEAEDVLRRSFNLLRQDLSHHSKKSSKRTTEAEERQDVLDMRKDLDEAESVIEKEIDDIDSVASGKNR